MPSQVIQTHAFLPVLEAPDELRILLSNKLVGVLWQTQVVWQSAAAVFAWGDSHDGGVVRVLLVAVLVQLLLRDGNDLLQRGL